MVMAGPPGEWLDKSGFPWQVIRKRPLLCDGFGFVYLTSHSTLIVMRSWLLKMCVRFSFPGALLVLLLVAGCRSNDPRLATRPYTEEEWMWSRSTKEMYPDWQEPDRPPPPRRLNARPAQTGAQLEASRPATAAVPSPMPAPRPLLAPSPSPAPAPTAAPTPSPLTTAPPAVARSSAISEALHGWQPVSGSSTPGLPPALNPPAAVPTPPPAPAIVPPPVAAPQGAMPAPVVDDPRAARNAPPADNEAFQIVAPNAAPNANDGGRPAQYTVKKGDSLSSISRRFYGNESGWKAILEANRERLPDPDHVPAGTILRLP
jgi:hypothetical protein